VTRLFRTPAKPVWGRAILSLGSIVLILGLLYSQIAASNTGDAIGAKLPKEAHDRIPGASSSSGRPAPYNAAINKSSGASSQSTPTQSSQSTGVSKDNTTISKADPNSSVTSGASSGNTGAQVTLTDYLGKMFCTGCDKHCSLLALKCDRGLPQLEAAKQKYQAIYGSATLN